MPEETRDAQATGQSSVKSEEKPDFLSGLDKYADELGLFKDEQPEEKVEKKATKAKPCENCPDEDEEVSGAKTTRDKVSAPGERKPFKVLKVDGKDHPVYSQEEYDELAAKGLGFRESKTADAKVSEVEDRLNAALEQLDRIETYARGPQEAAGPEKESKDEEVELETIDDPAVRNELKQLREQVKGLSKQATVGLEASRSSKVKELSTALDNLVSQSREKYPFEDIKFEGEDENYSEKLFAGVVQHLVSDDKVKTGKLRPIQNYIQDAVKQLNRIESFYKGKYEGKGGGGKGTMTADVIISKYPDIAKEIGQKAIAAHLKVQEDAPPVVKSRSEDVLGRKDGKSKSGGYKGLDDAIEAALSNPEFSEALAKELGK